MSNKKESSPQQKNEQLITDAIDAWSKHDTEHRNALIIITDRMPGSDQIRIAASYTGKPLTLADVVCAVLENSDDKNIVGDILRAAIHKYMLRSQQREAKIQEKNTAINEIASYPTTEVKPTTTEKQ